VRVSVRRVVERAGGFGSVEMVNVVLPRAVQSANQ
jgi:hypothetical protein